MIKSISLNSFSKAACVFMLFFYSCSTNQQNQDEDISEYRFVATNDSVILPRKFDRVEGIRVPPRPVHFWDSINNEFYFYRIKQTKPGQIIKYKSDTGVYNIVDSIDLPDQAKIDGLAHLEDFRALGIDSFFLHPVGTYSQYLIMGQNSLNIFDVPSDYKGLNFYVLLAQANCFQPIIDNKVIGRLYNPETFDGLKIEKVIPRIGGHSLLDTTEKFTAMYMPSELALLDKDINFVAVDSMLYATSSLEHFLYTYNFNSQKNEKILLKAPFFNKQFMNKNGEEYYKQLFESDFIKEMKLHPEYPNTLFLEIHISEQYVVNGHKKNFWDAERKLLLYDLSDNFRLRGFAHLSPSIEGMNTKFMQPTKDGFFMLEFHKVDNENVYVYKKYILEEVKNI